MFFEIFKIRDIFIYGTSTKIFLNESPTIFESICRKKEKPN